METGRGLLAVLLALVMLGPVTRGGAALPGTAQEAREDGAAAAETTTPPGPTALAPEDLEQLVEEVSRAEATEIAEQDAKISERLRSIFAALEGLRGVELEVQAGIVVLGGTTRTRDEAERAATIAQALDGVVLVVDEVLIDRSMSVRLARSWEQAVGQFRTAVASLPLLAAGLAIAAAFWLLARFLRDASVLYRFASERVLLQNLLRQTIYVAVILGGLVVALRFLDAGTLIGTALGAAGVVGLALGFAFRNIVENYLAGILLAIRQPFRMRDVVSIDGASGTVLRMTTSETTLLDADGNHLRLPNAMVFNGKVLNYTRNPLRRFTVAVSVGTNVDLAHAQELGVATLDRMNGVVEDPAPSAAIAALGDSSVSLELYGWVDQRNVNYLRAASEAQRLVKAAFDQHGIDMPAPAYVIQLDSPLAASPSLTETPRPESRAVPQDSGPAPESLDLSAPDDVTGQVEAEILRAEDENLLVEPE